MLSLTGLPFKSTIEFGGSWMMVFVPSICHLSASFGPIVILEARILNVSGIFSSNRYFSFQTNKSIDFLLPRDWMECTVELSEQEIRVIINVTILIVIVVEDFISKSFWVKEGKQDNWWTMQASFLLRPCSFLYIWNIKSNLRHEHCKFKEI